MTQVIVAAGINNELKSRDIFSIRRLLQAGYDVEFYYYLPRVPAEYSMIPSFNENLKKWKIHASNMLNELGNKLNIEAKHRHFVDEILGPDRVFDEAREMDADIILTNDTKQLRQSLLTRIYDYLAALFKGEKLKEVPTENVSIYTDDKLGRQAIAVKYKPQVSRAVNEPSVWTQPTSRKGSKSKTG